MFGDWPIDPPCLNCGHSWPAARWYKVFLSPIWICARRACRRRPAWTKCSTRSRERRICRKWRASRRRTRSRTGSRRVGAPLCCPPRSRRLPCRLAASVRSAAPNTTKSSWYLARTHPIFFLLIFVIFCLYCGWQIVCVCLHEKLRLIGDWSREVCSPSWRTPDSIRWEPRWQALKSPSRVYRRIWTISSRRLTIIWMNFD